MSANYQFTQTGAEIQAILDKAQSPDSAPTAGSQGLVTSGGVKTALDEKVDKVSGKGLSANDFTDAEKSKLAGVAAGAQVNVIEGVQVNGSNLPVSGKKVNVTVPAPIDNLTVGQANGHWTLSKIRLIDENHTIVAEHTKETIFRNRGYETKNAVKFTSAGTALTYNFYHGICCFNKNAATVGHNENYTDMSFTGSQSNYLRDTGFRMFEAYNSTQKLSGYIESRIVDDGGMFEDSACIMFVWDRTGDSKYYRQTPNFVPTNGARFSSVMAVSWNKVIAE